MSKVEEALEILGKYLRCFGKNCEDDDTIECFDCEYDTDEMEVIWAIQVAYDALKPTISVIDYDERKRCPTCGQVIWQED